MQEYSSIPIKTFTLVYEESHKGKDADRMLARAIADRIGSEHHEHLMRVSDIPEALSDIVEAFDEPFSGVLSTYFLSQEIRRHVKVALSGDGADELFGSYLSHRLAEPLARSREGKEYLHCFDGQPRTQADLKRFRELRKYRPDVACRMRMYISNDSEVKSLYLPNMGQAVGAISTQDLVAKYYPEVLCSDPINRELFLDQHTLLPDQVLAFVDRLSMANSVEVRPPFLSKEMIRFANRLPGTMKMKNGRSKHILKQAVEGLLPEQVLNRPKEGFLMPMNQWIGGSLFPLFDSVLSDSQLKKHEIFRKERVRALLTEHKLGRRNHGNRLWNLLLFQMWWNQYQD